MERIFFDSWPVLGRTALIGMLAYAALILLLRVSGKRTLSKMNAFDFVVTVALGSTLASILVSRDVALAQGALAFALLIALQYVITWSSVRVSYVRRIITGEPTLILHKGKILEGTLRRVRVTKDEVRAAVRAAGFAALADVEAVVLETDGSFSVIERSADGDAGESLVGVRRHDADARHD